MNYIEKIELDNATFKQDEHTRISLVVTKSFNLKIEKIAESLNITKSLLIRSVIAKFLGDHQKPIKIEF